MNEKTNIPLMKYNISQFNGKFIFRNVIQSSTYNCILRATKGAKSMRNQRRAQHGYYQLKMLHQKFCQQNFQCNLITILIFKW
jgi:hypothetical protein